MKAKVMTAILATIMLTMTACGTISPPIQNAVTETTATTTAESIHDSAASSEAESSLEDEQIKTDTFIAEFFDSDISFVDTSELVTEAMKGCSFENEIDNSNGVNKITLKGSNGGGMIDFLCIDLSQSDLDHDMEYILENFGDHYFRQMKIHQKEVGRLQQENTELRFAAEFARMEDEIGPSVGHSSG